jgi:UDPglucose 6-dehydrogenase
VYDPMYVVSAMRSSLVPINVTLVVTPEELAQDCDALLLLNNNPSFHYLNYVKLAALMRTPIVIDGCNFFDPSVLTKAGFYYVGIGRPSHRVALHNQQILQSTPLTSPPLQILVPSIHAA